MTIQNHNNAQHNCAAQSLYSNAGERKYINADERYRFLKVAERCDPHVQAFCMTLAYSGCRLSEALTLTPASIQPYAKVLSIRSLKKRNGTVIREVPIPDILIHQLDLVFQSTHQSIPFWTWKRTWAWVQVKRVMARANIRGLQASPKGLRHGFGVHAVQSGVPLNLVQKWLGHAQLSTTAIYANAVGPEEYAIAERMW